MFYRRGGEEGTGAARAILPAMSIAATGHKRSAGFSLLDLIFAMAIVAILASLAVPGFMTSVRKSRRADAIESLRSLQLAQERWRANNPAYGTLANLGIPGTTPGGWYTLAVSAPGATGYTATATALSGNSQVSDVAAGTSCSTLTVNQDTPVFSPTGQSACWGQ